MGHERPRPVSAQDLARDVSHPCVDEVRAAGVDRGHRRRRSPCGPESAVETLHHLGRAEHGILPEEAACLPGHIEGSRAVPEAVDDQNEAKAFRILTHCPRVSTDLFAPFRNGNACDPERWPLGAAGSRSRLEHGDEGGAGSALGVDVELG